MSHRNRRGRYGDQSSRKSGVPRFPKYYVDTPEAERNLRREMHRKKSKESESNFKRPSHRAKNPTPPKSHVSGSMNDGMEENDGIVPPPPIVESAPQERNIDGVSNVQEVEREKEKRKLPPRSYGQSFKPRRRRRNKGESERNDPSVTTQDLVVSDSDEEDVNMKKKKKRAKKKKKKPMPVSRKKRKKYETSSEDEDEKSTRRKRKRKPSKKKSASKPRRKTGDEEIRIDIPRAKKDFKSYIKHLVEEKGLTRNAVRNKIKALHANVTTMILQRDLEGLLKYLIREHPRGSRIRVIRIPREMKEVPPTPNPIYEDPPSPPPASYLQTTHDPFNTPVPFRGVNAIPQEEDESETEDELDNDSEFDDDSDDDDDDGDGEKYRFNKDQDEPIGMDLSTSGEEAVDVRQEERSPGLRFTFNEESDDDDDDDDDDDIFKEFEDDFIENEFRRNFATIILPKKDNETEIKQHVTEDLSTSKFTMNHLLKRIDLSSIIHHEKVKSVFLPYCYYRFPDLRFSCFNFFSCEKRLRIPGRYYKRVKPEETAYIPFPETIRTDEPTDDDRFMDLANRYYNYYSKIHQFTQPISSDSIFLHISKVQGLKGNVVYFDINRWKRNYPIIVKSQFYYDPNLHFLEDVKEYEQEQQRKKEKEKESIDEMLMDDEDSDDFLGGDINTDPDSIYKDPSFYSKKKKGEKPKKEEKIMDLFESSEVDGLMKLEQKIHDFFSILRKNLIDRNESVCIRGVGSKIAIMYQFILSLRCYFVIKRDMMKKQIRIEKERMRMTQKSGMRQEEISIVKSSTDNESDENDSEEDLDDVRLDDCSFIIIHGFEVPRPTPRALLDRIIRINHQKLITPVSPSNDTKRRQILRKRRQKKLEEMEDEDEDEDEDEEEDDEDMEDKHPNNRTDEDGLDRNGMEAMEDDVERIVDLYSRGEGKRVAVVIFNVEMLPAIFLRVLSSLSSHFFRKRDTLLHMHAATGIPIVRNDQRNKGNQNKKKKRRNRRRMEDEDEDEDEGEDDEDYKRREDGDDDEWEYSPKNIAKKLKSRIHFLFTCSDPYSNRLISKFVDRFYYLDTFRVPFYELENEVCGDESEPDRRIRLFFEDYWTSLTYNIKTIWACILDHIFYARRKMRSIMLGVLRTEYPLGCLNDQLIEFLCDESKYLRLWTHTQDLTKKKITISILTIADLLKIRETEKVMEVIRKELAPIAGRRREEYADVNDENRIGFEFKAKVHKKKKKQKKKEKKRSEMIDEDEDEDEEEEEEDRHKKKSRRSKPHSEPQHESDVINIDDNADGGDEIRLLPTPSDDFEQEKRDSDDDDDDDNDELSIFLRTLSIFQNQD